MTMARREVVRSDEPGWYHCVSRCVRRAFLCGDGLEHRRDWIRSRLAFLTRFFTVQVGSYAVMSNHLHVVVRLDPSGPLAWSDEDTARAWLQVFPREWGVLTGTADHDEDAVQELARDAAHMARIRCRFGDLGWFMKALKEPIARKANREDGATGAFWEGRYKCQALLDQSALIASMVYVDLNPIRAKMAKTPETSDHTSVQDRISIRQAYAKVQGLRERAPARAQTLLAGRAQPRHAEDGVWVRGLKDCAVAPELPHSCRITLDEYLKLIDGTGRIMRTGKRGSIPADLAPILARLDLDVERWLDWMCSAGAWLGSTLGGLASRTAEAARRGLRWLRNSSTLYAVSNGAVSVQGVGTSEGTF